MTHDLNALKQSLVSFGATKTAHLNGDLLSHMTNVYLNLKTMERPEHVMLAGLFHGVYGTHALHGEQLFDLDLRRRNEVSALIGERAERLVYVFCAMTYESLGKSVRKQMRAAGEPELRNRSTNEPLPVSVEEFDDVLWVKLADLLAHLPQLPPAIRTQAESDYGPFWQLVAGYLGPPAIALWNRHVGHAQRIAVA